MLEELGRLLHDQRDAIEQLVTFPDCLLATISRRASKGDCLA
jgi:hypothetical protein